CVVPSVARSVVKPCNLGIPVLLGLSEDEKVVSPIFIVEVSKCWCVPVVKEPVSVTPCVVPSVARSVVKPCNLGIPVLLGLSEDEKVVSPIFIVEVSKYCFVPVVKVSVSVTPSVVPSD